MHMRVFLTVVVSTLLGLLLGELGGRAIGLEPRQYEDAPRGIYEAPDIMHHPDAGWVNRPGVWPSREAGHLPMTVWSNGGRATGPESRKDALATAYVIGGSFAMGYGVRDKDSFAYQLNGLYPELWIENLGVSAYGTYQALLSVEPLLQQGDGDEISRLVIYGFINDHLKRNVATFGWVKAISGPSSSGPRWSSSNVSTN